MSGIQGRSWKFAVQVRQTILLICIISIWLIPSVTFAQTAGPIYIVQPGDTLYIIAQRFGTSVEALASANGITDASLITPGLELVIPGYEGVPGVLDFHELGYGETIYSLSAQLGLPADAIIKLNRILQPERLYIGQAMIISKSGDDEDGALLKVVLTEGGESKLAFAAVSFVWRSLSSRFSFL